MEKRFNLSCEPWIRVLRDDGTVSLVSIQDTLTNAHNIIALSNDCPSQDITILRILLAAIHRIFAHGLRTEDEALDVWEGLYNAGHFPPDPINDYFDAHREEFWLLHPTNPFWQTLEVKGKNVEIFYSKLRSAVLQSENKKAFKYSYTQKSLMEMTDAELARGLVTLNQFDDTALKTGSGVGYLSGFAVISAAGSSLFETLMLNFTVINSKTGKPWRSAIPYWEKPLPHQTGATGENKKALPIPEEIANGDNLAYLLSKPSRQGHLVPEEKKYVSGGPGGWSVGDTVPTIEPMVMRTPKWDAKHKTIEAYVPLTQPSAQMWRDAGSIIDVDNPNVMCLLPRFHSKLAEYGILPADTFFRYSVLSTTFGPSNGNIEDFALQAFDAPAIILSQKDQSFWMNRVLECVRLAQGVAEEYERYCYRAWAAAIGGDGSTKGREKIRNIAVSRREEFYATLDLPFREWMDRIQPELDEPDPDAAEMMTDWIRILKQAVMIAADDFEKSLGVRAQRIRRESGNGATTYRSAADEYIKFAAAVNKQLSETANGGKL